MRPEFSPARSGSRQAKNLIRCGIAAGPVYVVVGVAQILMRPGFDIRRHALSQLSNGHFGWVQIGNFLICGILVILGAIGLRKALRGSRGGTWAPILLAGYGIGLIGASIFSADPGAGFPPGTPQVTQISRSGLLHFVFGGFGFYALIAASFVLAKRFFGLKQTGMAAYSIFTGIAFFISFAMIASG